MAPRRSPKLRQLLLKNSNPSRALSLMPRVEHLEERMLLTGTSPFVGGDIIVERYGDGGNDASSNDGNAIFLDEYSPSGTLISSTEMPFNSTQAPLYTGDNPSPPVGGVGSSNPNPIVGSGSAGTTGYLQLSADGTALTFAGYDVNLPFNGTTSLKKSTQPRDIASVGINKTLDDSTALTDYSVASTPTDVVSPDGVNLYADSNQTADVRFATVNDANPATTSTDIFATTGGPITKGGTESIYNGYLYIDNGSGIYQVTKAAADPGLNSTYPNLPSSLSSGNATATKLLSVSTLGNFFFATMDGAAHLGSSGLGGTPARHALYRQQQWLEYRGQWRRGKRRERSTSIRRPRSTR